jgi:hypothetical protein
LTKETESYIPEKRGVDNQGGQQTKRKEMIKVFPTHAASFVMVSIKREKKH